MVEQTQAGPPGARSRTLPGSLGLRLPARRRLAQTEATTPEPGVTAPRLLLVMMVALLLPGNFTVAGAQLSPNRMLLLVLFPYLAWRWLKGRLASRTPSTSSCSSARSGRGSR